MRDIDRWEELTNRITSQWVKTYFELGDDEDITIDWVADDVGGIFEFADYFFSFSDILDCYKHKITKEQLFNWYEHNISEPYVNISLAKFILSPEERAKREKESLDISKKNLEMAQEEFNKTMEKYEIRKDK
jgi:hypothetical protein